MSRRQACGLRRRQLFRCRHRGWIVDAGQPDLGDNRSTAEKHGGRVVDLDAIMAKVAVQRYGYGLVIEPHDAVLDREGRDAIPLTEADGSLTQPGCRLILLRKAVEVGAKTEG